MDHGANLSELDHQLRRVRWNDQHIRMRLHQHTGVLLVGLAHLLARGDGLIHTSVEIGRLHDARAISAVSAKAGELPAVTRLFARLHLAHLCHRQHERQRVLAAAASACNYQRMGQAFRSDGRAQVVDDRSIA